MGIYLNPGNVLFQDCLNSAIYVDKTELIRYTNAFINTENKFMCVSRPRRFGKSMALKMLAAYYSRDCDSEEMFRPLKIGQTDAFEKERNRYDTLLIDMQGTLGSVLYEAGTQEELKKFYREFPDMTEMERKISAHPLLLAVQRAIIRDIRQKEQYAAYIPEEETFLGNALRSVYHHTGRQFVLLIDEWDCIFRNYEEDRTLQDKYIDFLRDMFKSTLMLPVFALVYMTGILPIKRYGTQSALNHFKEYTMLFMSPLEEFTGFTEEETKTLYLEHGMDAQKGQAWYDGYALGESGHIYNPNSVIESINRRDFQNYWTATGTYESVKKLIEMNFDGLKEKVILMLGNERCRINPAKFQNDMVTFHSADDVLTLLVHLGYLAYDGKQREVYIPNKEVRDEFVNAIDGEKWTYTLEAIADSEKLLEETLAGNEEAVAAAIEKIHEDHTAILTYHNENALSCVIQIAYYQAQDEYMLVRELPAGKGFADIVFLPRKGVDKPAIVVELKWKKDVQTALDQIHSKNYGEKLQRYYGEILLVAVNYDKEGGDKRHTCRIERINKRR